MRFSELLAAVGRELAPAHLPSSEAEILTAAVLRRSRGEVQLAALLDTAVADEDAARVLAAARHRARRVPLQHITGEAHFYGRTFAVGPGVFVPRPETEVLVRAVVQQLRGAEGGTVVDIGAGSGAIAVSLANELPQLRVLALESSPFAWPWLRRNLCALAPGVDARFGDWQQSLRRIPAPLTALVSNPPYIPARDVPRDPEVHLFDPAPALYSGEDGLDELRRIAAVAAARLQPGGVVLVEHTETQGKAVRALFEEAGLVAVTTIDDLTGRPRHTGARQPGGRGE